MTTGFPLLVSRSSGSRVALPIKLTLLTLLMIDSPPFISFHRFAFVPCILSTPLYKVCCAGLRHLGLAPVSRQLLKHRRKLASQPLEGGEGLAGVARMHRQILPDEVREAVHLLLRKHNDKRFASHGHHLLSRPPVLVRRPLPALTRTKRQAGVKGARAKRERSLWEAEPDTLLSPKGARPPPARSGVTDDSAMLPASPCPGSALDEGRNR